MADVVKINEKTYRIEDGEVRFFLFCGSEKAALIDTGMNVPEARKIVEGLTDLPLILINTHADMDHISGNKKFDEIYISPAEEENYRESGGQGKIIPIHEGDEIDLGDRILRVIDIPGHTPGSIALLDEKNRILVSGDSVQDGNIFMFGKYRNIDLYIKSLNHLKEFDGLYDDIYPMHGTFPVKADLIDKLLVGANEIKAGKAEGKEENIFGTKAYFYKFPYAGFLCDLP